MRVAEEKGVRVIDVQSVKPGLEDAFIHVTGLSPDVMVLEKEGKR